MRRGSPAWPLPPCHVERRVLVPVGTEGVVLDVVDDGDRLYARQHAGPVAGDVGLPVSSSPADGQWYLLVEYKHTDFSPRLLDQFLDRVFAALVASGARDLAIGPTSPPEDP